MDRKERIRTFESTVGEASKPYRNPFLVSNYHFLYSVQGRCPVLSYSGVNCDVTTFTFIIKMADQVGLTLVHV